MCFLVFLLLGEGVRDDVCDEGEVGGGVDFGDD